MRSAEGFPAPRAPPRLAAVLAWSMRQQHRHRHRAQNGPGHAPEDELAQARMAEAAHYHEPGATVGSMRQDRARHVEAASGGDAFDLDLDAMTGEMAALVGA